MAYIVEAVGGMMNGYFIFAEGQKIKYTDNINKAKHFSTMTEAQYACDRIVTESNGNYIGIIHNAARK